jgi:hypothetical protein
VLIRTVDRLGVFVLGGRFVVRGDFKRSELLQLSVSVDFSNFKGMVLLFVQ